MPASAVCCLDLKGRLLLARDYRGDVPLRLAERFMSKLGELEEGSPRPPVVLMDGERKDSESDSPYWSQSKERTRFSRLCISTMH